MTANPTNLGEFVSRHIGPNDSDTQAMLAELGLDSLESLVDDAVPGAIRQNNELALDVGVSEAQSQAELRALADKNQVLVSMIGRGYYDTITPPVLRRNVLENPAWYTAYTPYQPEISQGRLEALLNFQTMVAELTGMEMANASLLDEGTAAAEGMALCHRKSRSGETFLIHPDTHPQTIAVVETRAEASGITVVVADPADTALDDVFGALISYPTSTGSVNNPRAVVERLHEAGAKVVVASDLLALVVLESPGSWGADVVVGSSQRFGVPMMFGGPHAGFMAASSSLARSLPGRLVGVSVDAHGDQALRLALQTREQHIRREKATSNICTAQVLLAVVAGLYAAWHGPEGLKAIAHRVNGHANSIAAGLQEAAIPLVHNTAFDTITARVPGRAQEIVAPASKNGINLRLVTGDTVGISCDETTTSAHVETVLQAFGAKPPEGTIDDLIPTNVRRTTPPLEHPIFGQYHSETGMMRYLRRLAGRGLALDRAMIPLGSCTMKLNAAAEMESISFPGFANIHPFVPIEQAAGYVELISSLEDWLIEITGYDAVSLQPNAGSQGEFAGLLAIRGYHESREDHQRKICVIPSSAHGTNAASAVLAGMSVSVVACDDKGNIDTIDLKAKIEAAGDRLAALMITYPSTHGVYEETVVDICDMVHAAGGQVYLDGANLNALVGLAQPGKFGADVSHLNLHKTFAIPHGGGGPGIGPVAARAHLAPFLPNHGHNPKSSEHEGPAVSAAPWGSAGVLPISWS
ncbi:MAG: aminomethyl-transferring glycine dehydrogenase, partial [Acidimicrobiales bacterium]